MSIFPLVVIIGALIAMGFITKTLFGIALDYGKRKEEGKK